MTYSRKKRRDIGAIVPEALPDSELVGGPEVGQVESGEKEDEPEELGELDLPIAPRKQPRSCTQRTPYRTEICKL